MGFTLQGFPLATIGAPLGALALLPFLTAPRLPGGQRLLCSRLQGLVPVTSPCCRRNHEWSRPSIPSWGFALQSMLPFDLALALDRDASPLALRRLDV
jgi:hypothetical protein